MPKKKELISKLFRKPYPKNFSIRELDNLTGHIPEKNYISIR